MRSRIWQSLPIGPRFTYKGKKCGLHLARPDTLLVRASQNQTPGPQFGRSFVCSDEHAVQEFSTVPFDLRAGLRAHTFCGQTVDAEAALQMHVRRDKLSLGRHVYALLLYGSMFDWVLEDAMRRQCGKALLQVEYGAQTELLDSVLAIATMEHMDLYGLEVDNIEVKVTPV